MTSPVPPLEVTPPAGREEPVLLNRIHSMDQFRGFIIASMFAVNFGFGAFTHRMFDHDGGHAAFADIIMPGFLFAVGFAFRASALRRYPKQGFARMAAGYFRRSLLLILIVLLMEGFGQMGNWEDFNQLPRRYQASVAEGVDATSAVETAAEEAPGDSTLPRYFALHWVYWVLGIFRRKLCEVLGIIAITQIIVLPFILAGPRVRISALAGFALLHVLVTYWFNWEFIQGRPNIVDAWLSYEPRHCWDGGFFGNLSWGAVMLAGSLTYDMVADGQQRVRVSLRLFALGLLVMAAGYITTVPSRLYDIRGETEAAQREFEQQLAATPVLPLFENKAGREFRDWLPRVPVFQDRGDVKIAGNYWTASKQVVSLPFVLFSCGFCLSVYALFVLLTDRFGLQIGVFRTLGTNALAAYVIHYYVGEALQRFYPAGAPHWFDFVAFGFYFAIVYFFVRTLERRNLYIRL